MIAERMDEDGFTLVELLVVMLTIGILATIAIPTFFTQSGKARDAGTKSDLRALVQHVENCRVDTTSYRFCDETSELNDTGGLTFGTSAGDVGVVSADHSTFTAYGISKAKTDGSNHLYIWQRAGGDTNRFCLKLNFQALNAGGCSNSGW